MQSSFSDLECQAQKMLTCSDRFIAKIDLATYIQPERAQYADR